MDGKNHRIFAPIFAFGCSQLFLKWGIISPQLGQMGVGVITASSLLSATLPDADLFATYPTMAITDAMPSRKRGGYYVFRDRSGKIHKYRPPRSKVTRVAALFMKSIGVRKHRDWKTHAPTIFFPLGFLIIKLTNILQLKGEMATFTGLLQSVIIGIVLGYISHIVGDIPNKGGVPLGPSNKQYSITKRVFGNKLSNFFRSGNKVWNTIFIAGSLNLVLFIMNKDMAIKLNTNIYRIVMTVLGPLLNIIKNVFVTLLG